MADSSFAPAIFYDFMGVGKAAEKVSNCLQESNNVRPSCTNSSLRLMNSATSSSNTNPSVKLIGFRAETCVGKGESEKRITSVCVKRKDINDIQKRGYKRRKTQSPEEEEKKKKSEVIVNNDFSMTKRLEAADVDSNTRLLLRKEQVMQYILPYLSEQQKEEVEMDGGMAVTVNDLDTKTDYSLKFKNNGKRKEGSQGRNSFYVLMNGWTQFVKRRVLKKGDVVGLNFNAQNSRFEFAVIKRQPDWVIVPADFWKP